MVDDWQRDGPQPIRIVRSTIPLTELRAILIQQFGDFVKAVVDCRRGCMAIGGELHSDGEAVLLADGSQQRDLWGINIYPDLEPTEWIEFDSMINLRPGQGNISRGVDDAETRKAIDALVQSLIDEAH